MDLVFLIDSSRSVRPHEFETMRKFMIDILDTLDIGLNATRVGVVQYSSQVRNTSRSGCFSLSSRQTSDDVNKHATCSLCLFFYLQVRSEFSLKTHAKLDTMVKGINQIIPLAQGTMTGLAIRYVMNVAFTAEEGDRPKVTQEDLCSSFCSL